MEQKEKKALTDTEVIANFDRLLKELNKTWDESPKDFEKFEVIKQKAKLTPLYPRQMGAIIDRCDNVIAGHYGNTKKSENYEQAKPSK